MDTNKKNYFSAKGGSASGGKFTLILILCLLVRLIPFRAPNVEPILASMMPFSRVFGALAGFSFAILSILLYDVITGTLGIQTFFTATAYGLLGLWSANYFSTKDGSTSGEKDNKWSYVRFAIWGTLFYDAITGLTIGPIFFHQSFFQTLVGQIPFTMLHLTGNIIFAFILSPVIYNFVIKKKEKLTPINILNPQII